MLRNYLKTALRSMRRQVGFSSINLLGLTIGFAAAFFILLWVQDEKSYDRFHLDADRTYRVMRNWHQSDGYISTAPSLPMPLAEVLASDFPEIENVSLFSYEFDHALTSGNIVFRETGRYAGADFFEMFSWGLLEGSPESVLALPNAIVLSENLAEKYYGLEWQSKNIVGSILTMDNEVDLVVSGVFSNVPANSTYTFEFIINVEEFNRTHSWVHHWGNSGLRMFVRLQEGVDASVVSEKIKNIVVDNHPTAATELFLQSYADMHLLSEYENGKLAGGRIEYVRIFSIVGLFLLLIGSINFMNLATARSTQRAREIGVRKAMGGNRSSIVQQFLSESVLMALMAFAAAIAAVILLLPVFNTLTGKEIEILTQPASIWLAFLAIAAITGLLAGSYPAFYLSAFNVIGVLRGEHMRKIGGNRLRKGLVVFQFALSIVLIAATVTVYRQVQYIMSKDLGMDKSNLVQMPFEGNVKSQFESFKNELLSKPGVAQVTSASQLAFNIGTWTSDPEWEGKDPDDNTSFMIINGQADYAEIMGFELVAGRFFSESFGADSMNYLVNEAAVDVMGFDDPLGQTLSFWSDEGQIIGVMKDFHGQSLYEPIRPAIVRYDPESTFLLFVRLIPGQTSEGIASLEATFRQYNPEFPFQFTFADDDYAASYKSEITFGKLANIFAVLALFVACLGLFGLASYTAERRTKEIGIRKVLGATISNIVMMLSKEFVLLVVLALAIAVPIAQRLSSNWLSQFAFHVESGYGVFIIASAAILMVTFLTVGFQSIRAALLNPAESLKDE
ncbi:MAG: ABC transporter permease [Bacteroidetes bacterium]|nr:ABC transporter permease [Bacteroidota bacterium]